MRCFHCQKELVFSGKIGFREVCSCGSDAHVCLNCAHYDVSSYNACRESQAERVLDKGKANFCEYWTPSSPTGRKVDADPKAAFEAQWNQIFKKGN